MSPQTLKNLQRALLFMARSQAGISSLETRHATWREKQSDEGLLRWREKGARSLRPTCLQSVELLLRHAGCGCGLICLSRGPWISSDESSPSLPVRVAGQVIWKR